VLKFVRLRPFFACKYSESRVFECEKDRQCPVSDIGALLYQILEQKQITIVCTSKQGKLNFVART